MLHVDLEQAVSYNCHVKVVNQDSISNTVVGYKKNQNHSPAYGYCNIKYTFYWYVIAENKVL